MALMQSVTADELRCCLRGGVHRSAVLTVAFWPKIEAGLPVFTPESSVVLDPNAQEYVGEKPNPNKGNPDAVNTQIPGYKSIEMDAKSGELSIAPHNPEGNPCYLLSPCSWRERRSIKAG